MDFGLAPLARSAMTYYAAARGSPPPGGGTGTPSAAY
jgi:hypothetical protein